MSQENFGRAPALALTLLSRQVDKFGARIKDCSASPPTP